MRPSYQSLVLAVSLLIQTQSSYANHIPVAVNPSLSSSSSSSSSSSVTPPAPFIASHNASTRKDTSSHPETGNKQHLFARTKGKKRKGGKWGKGKGHMMRPSCGCHCHAPPPPPEPIVIPVFHPVPVPVHAHHVHGHVHGHGHGHAHRLGVGAGGGHRHLTEGDAPAAGATGSTAALTGPDETTPEKRSLETFPPHLVKRTKGKKKGKKGKGGWGRPKMASCPPCHCPSHHHEGGHGHHHRGPIGGHGHAHPMGGMAPLMGGGGHVHGMGMAGAMPFGGHVHGGMGGPAPMGAMSPMGM